MASRLSRARALRLIVVVVAIVLSVSMRAAVAVVPPEASAVFDAVLNKAENGDAKAQFNVGLLYAKGVGVAKDVEQAAKWFRLAAEQGYAEAQYNLGLAYNTGMGVPKDNTQAAKWIGLAAEQGITEAQFNLCLSCLTGAGIPKDIIQAVKWLRLAAAQGNAEAQYNLAVLYDKGLGVQKDAAEAAKWYRLAAEQRHSRAMANLRLPHANGEVKQDQESRTGAGIDIFNAETGVVSPPSQRPSRLEKLTKAFLVDNRIPDPLSRIISPAQKKAEREAQLAQDKLVEEARKIGPGGDARSIDALIGDRNSTIGNLIRKIAETVQPPDNFDPNFDPNFNPIDFATDDLPQTNPGLAEAFLDGTVFDLPNQQAFDLFAVKKKQEEFDRLKLAQLSGGTKLLAALPGQALDLIIGGAAMVFVVKLIMALLYGKKKFSVYKYMMSPRISAHAARVGVIPAYTVLQRLGVNALVPDNAIGDDLVLAAVIGIFLGVVWDSVFTLVLIVRYIITSKILQKAVYKIRIWHRHDIVDMDCVTVEIAASRANAEKGDAKAQFLLGTSYGNGNCVTKDYIQAYLWFNLAAANGHQVARDARERLEPRMTPAQIAEAQRLSVELQAKIDLKIAASAKN